MSFGAALAGFAQGFGGGLKMSQDFYLTRERIGLAQEDRAEKTKKREAEERGKRRANARITANTTGSTGSVGSTAIPVSRSGADPVPGVVSDGGSNPTVAIAPARDALAGSDVFEYGRHSNYDDPELRDWGRQERFAEGGMVRPEDLPAQAVPVAVAPVTPAAPVTAPVQAVPAVAVPVTPGVTPAAAPAAPPGNYNDPEMREKVPDPVLGGLHYMREAFGLNQPAAPAAPQQAIPGAAPAAAPADPQQAQRVAALIRGEGAASNEEVAQAARRVDPQGEMPLAQRNVILLEEMTNAYYEAGMIKEGNEASASLLQNFRRNMQMYGGMAVAAAENGNMEQAARLLSRAYEYVPDGNTVQASGSGSGVSLTTIGPDGKPKGAPMVLADAAAVRNAVGYATDMDNWAKHLLTERKVNGELALGQGRLDESIRHNRASEGLQGAALAERRAERAEAREARKRAEDRLVAGEGASTEARLAYVDARRAKEQLDALGEDATVEQRQAAMQKLDEARDRAERLEARTPTGLAARISSTDNQDERVALERQRVRDAEKDRELRRQRDAELDPLKKREIQTRIDNLEARTRLADRTPGGRSGRSGDLTFDQTNKLDEAYANVPPGSLNPEQFEEGRGITQGLARANPGRSALDYANAGVRIRQGQFEEMQQAGPNGGVMLRVGNQAFEVPASVAPVLRQYREQGKPAERTGPSVGTTLGRVGSAVIQGPAAVQQQRGAAQQQMGVAVTPRAPADPMASAVERVSGLLRGRNLPPQQIEVLIRTEAARMRVSADELRRALGR